MLLSIVILIVTLVLVYFAFINFYPSFGGDVNKERQAQYQSSPQFSEGKFINTKKEIPEAASFSKFFSIGRKFFFEKVENSRPSKDLAIQKIDSMSIASFEKGTRLFWFGHSAFLVQMDGLTILIDPMLGKVPAPTNWMGANRFN